MKKFICLMIVVYAVALSCQPDVALVPGSDQVAGSDKNARVSASAAFGSRQKLGTVQDASLDEISGLAYSRVNPGYIWVEEDSGNPNRIYLIDEKGSTKATIALPSGITNRDWEDIAIGPGPAASTWYIYLANIGDNSSSNSYVYVYRFVEPSIQGRSLPFNATLSSSAVTTFTFKYADGPRNAETLMIDPLTKDLFIISKEGSRGGVYKATYPQNASGVTTLSRSGTVPVSIATGGDISADGREILIKNYTTVYYWKKTFSSQTISQLLTTSPATLSYTEEPGGEAIGWKYNGQGYYTISEIKNNILPAIYYYPRQ